jgi:hypothetical protein
MYLSLSESYSYSATPLLAQKLRSPHLEPIGFGKTIGNLAQAGQPENVKLVKSLLPKVAAR